jgi:hypothetical protein
MVIGKNYCYLCGVPVFQAVIVFCYYYYAVWLLLYPFLKALDFSWIAEISHLT